MPPKKSNPKVASNAAKPRRDTAGSNHRTSPTQPSPFERAWSGPEDRTIPPTVSGRWLLSAIGVTLAAAAVCAWGALCLLFWQGSWQLLYHPTAAVTRTPASVGLAFESVGFASTGAGAPRLSGWWIPGTADARFTVLYLHGRSGNLGDTVDALAQLHAAGVNVLALDYRGYGQSEFVRPSEARWREDAGWALDYLTETRHIAAGAIVVDGDELGADLAIETAAAHPELAGAIATEPMASPTEAIFSDGRARLVPAHLLVADRWNLDTAAAAVRVPSLWFEIEDKQTGASAYDKVAAHKMRVWLPPDSDARQTMEGSLARWFADLKP